jgi:pimeloyl-ACP methyl ester carboxylesterase
VRPVGVEADTVDRTCPARSGTTLLRRQSAARRTCELAGLGHKHHSRGTLWRTFLAEQRALLRGLDELEHALPALKAPVLVLADPRDNLVPIETARRLVQSLPHARLQLINGGGHHLPRRAPGAVADAIAAFLAAMDAGQPDSARSAGQRPLAPALVA